jgi:ABC-2 type transport system ATP-binding protein
MNSPVIVTENLVKTYGRVQALRGVSIAVEHGEIFGLLGQNGAGKTTLIKILLGITKPTSGSATLLGARAGATNARRQVGYLPEDHHFPDYHTGYSLLDFYGALQDMPGSARRKRIPYVLGLVGLVGRMHYKIRTYSKGMKQRVGIAQALLHDPEVIFLDEPTDGIDPVGRRDVRKLLQHLKEEGKTIFVNSHLLGEIELMCDRVAVLQAGRLVKIGDVASLTRQEGTFEIGLAPGQDFPESEAARLGCLVHPVGERWELQLPTGRSIDAVVELLRNRGLSLRHLVEKRQTLEDMFMETVVAAEPDQQPAEAAVQQ